MINIDDTDRKILKILQSDSSQSLETLSEQVGASLNTCWRRIQRLEENGAIKKRVVLLDEKKLGKPLTVFVSVRTNDHSKDWAERFAKAVKTFPEIVEFYRLAGDIDYLLKLLVADVEDYDRTYQRLIAKIGLSDVTASFAMEKVKFTTEVPL